MPGCSPRRYLAFGLGGLLTLIGPMIADAVDLDELSTGERREGMFGLILWWVVQVGQSGAILAGGFLLYSPGLDPARWAPTRRGDHLLATLVQRVRVVHRLRDRDLSRLAGHMYSITEKSALKVRAELERRRGTGAAGVPPQIV